MATIFFIASMLAIGGMIASKVFEIKVKKINFLSSIFVKGDNKIHSLIDIGVFKYYRYKKIGNIFIFDFLPSYTYEILVRMKDEVAKKYYKAGDGFRGRRILKSSGSVSFFLERLSDSKPQKDTEI